MSDPLIYCGDAVEMLRGIPDGWVQCCVTSPPYWGLRDYGVNGQIGNEPTPDDYASRLVAVMREVRRTLTKDGVLWLNLGDTYNNCDKWGGGGANTGKHTKSPDGSIPSWAAVRRKWGQIPGIKPKDLVGIPWLVAFALRADGWYLRQDIIWAKPNPMPESVRDRCTRSHEYLFLLTKSPKYYYNADAIAEPSVSDHDSGNGMRNRRDVWWITPRPFKEAHFATFPEELVEPCILAGSREEDVILDPFAGAGTVGLVCQRLNRQFIGIDINLEYVEMAYRRIAKAAADAR